VGSGDSAAGGYCAEQRSHGVYCKERSVGGFLSEAVGEDPEVLLLLVMVKRFP